MLATVQFSASNVKIGMAVNAEICEAYFEKQVRPIRKTKGKYERVAKIRWRKNIGDR